MSLPRRQQRILNQIEQALQAADPKLKSMFAAFGRSVRAQAGPAIEAISERPSRRTLVIFMMIVVCMFGVLVVGIRSTSSDCPGLSSDQVAAPAAVRYSGCTQSTDAWSRGGR
jgi:Protein of unknown function (DUF3040)